MANSLHGTVQETNRAQMIIGRGDIANALNDREGFIFFASGVSNSNENRMSEFDREEHLLSRFHGTDFSLVYFSSISIYTKQSEYTNHKLLMEEIVRENFRNHCIIRLGNISWGDNPNTFINYLKAHPEAEVRDEWKFIINESQLCFITNNLPRFGKYEISIFGEMKKVKDCL